MSRVQSLGKMGGVVSKAGGKTEEKGGNSDCRRCLVRCFGEFRGQLYKIVQVMLMLTLAKEALDWTDRYAKPSTGSREEVGLPPWQSECPDGSREVWRAGR